jgi:hypothetical protein
MTEAPRLTQQNPEHKANPTFSSMALCQPRNTHRLTWPQGMVLTPIPKNSQAREYHDARTPTPPNTRDRAREIPHVYRDSSKVLNNPGRNCGHGHRYGNVK